MYLNELVDYGELIRMRNEGYVKSQTHPDFPELHILNYTQKAQFDSRWNNITEICRGLIYNDKDGKVVARPFRKFFNYGQAGAPDLSLDTEIVAMDKMDGSLGILYQTPDQKFAIATRGSFASDQAIHATKILNDKYTDWLQENYAALQFVTPLFEIIYPENRIVCNYNDLDDLVLIGAEVLTAKDKTWDADQATYFFDWTGPTAKIFDYDTFGEALAAPPREGAEGFVIYVPKTGQRVKIKQEDYILLHRIVTGLNARTVWEYAKNNVKPDGLLESLPDEFHAWVKELWTDLKTRHRARDLELCYEYDKYFRQVLDEMGGANTREREFRKNFALAVKDHPWASYFFLMLVDKVYIHKIWEELKPEGNVTPSGKVFTEDNS